MRLTRTNMRRGAGTLAVLCSVAVGLFGAGCVSADLSGDAKIEGEVAECLPPGTPAPSMIASAIWFRNANGYGSVDETGMGHVSGVLALAGNNLWFMSWNDPEHHFDMQRVIGVLPALRVEVARAGAGAMLVVESGNRAFDSFELMSGGQIGSDPSATQSLYAKIQLLREKNPQPDLQ
jgi:hypothetical protein